MKFSVCYDWKTRTWVLYRKGKENHAHLKSKKSCYMLIRFIKQGTMPKSEYLIESCERLLSPEEMVHLKKKKDRYINQQRG